MLPPDASEYFRAWSETQRAYWPAVEEAFAPVPLRSAQFFDREVRGEAMLRQLGEALRLPTTFYYRGRPYQVHRENGAFVGSLDLPFTAREDVALTRHADELVLQVGA